MKKTAAGCFALICVLAVIVAVLSSIGLMRQNKINDSPALTLQEVEKLARTSVTSDAPAPGAVSSPQPGAPAAGKAVSKDRDASEAAKLPRRLNRPATDEERREQFIAGKSTGNKLIALVGSSPLGGFMDALGVAVGIPDGALANRGECYMTRGKWAEAKGCYSEFVRKSSDQRMVAIAYARLAWLEDDPELAARYMELATLSEYEFPLAWNRNLAQATGSPELAEHYQRLFQQRHQAAVERELSQNNRTAGQ